MHPLKRVLAEAACGGEGSAARVHVHAQGGICCGHERGLGAPSQWPLGDDGFPGTARRLRRVQAMADGDGRRARPRGARRIRPGCAARILVVSAAPRAVVRGGGRRRKNETGVGAHVHSGLRACSSPWDGAAPAAGCPVPCHVPGHALHRRAMHGMARRRRARLCAAEHGTEGGCTARRRRPRSAAAVPWTEAPSAGRVHSRPHPQSATCTDRHVHSRPHAPSAKHVHAHAHVQVHAAR